MPAIIFASIRAHLPENDWYYSQEPNLLAAQLRFSRRLKDYGITTSRFGGAVSERMSSVRTHLEMRSAAADMLAMLHRIQPEANAASDLNKLLEAAAAFFGLSNWDTLSAALPKARGEVDTAGALRDRGFHWSRTGSSLMLGGQDSLDAGWDAQGWLWRRDEAEQEVSRTRTGLSLPYVNIGTYRENWYRLSVPECHPSHKGKVVMEICRDCHGEDWCVLDWDAALKAIDDKVYLDWPAWLALKQAVGTERQESDLQLVPRRR